ncbi:MAG: hypothetical protein PVF58_13065 [Candidatus Methanofastidiosia archaeon]|jgi:hypothetical protein
MEKTAEKVNLEDIECDIVVRMPPVREITVKIQVKGIKKAILRVVEPEEVTEYQ